MATAIEEIEDLEQAGTRDLIEKEDQSGDGAIGDGGENGENLASINDVLEGVATESVDSAESVDAVNAGDAVSVESEKVDDFDKQLLSEIREVNAKVVRIQEQLEYAESELKEAKAYRDQVREDLLRASKELTTLISDSASGQRRLDFDGNKNTTTSGCASGSSAQSDDSCDDLQLPAKEEPFPLNDLSQKAIKALVGSEEFERFKSQEDPIGLSPAQLEKLEEQDIATVQELEQKLREKRDFLQSIKGFGDAVINRVISTLTAFRSKHPMPVVCDGSSDSDLSSDHSSDRDIAREPDQSNQLDDDDGEGDDQE